MDTDQFGDEICYLVVYVDCSEYCTYKVPMAVFSNKEEAAKYICEYQAYAPSKRYECEIKELGWEGDGWYKSLGCDEDDDD